MLFSLPKSEDDHGSELDRTTLAILGGIAHLPGCHLQNV